MMKRLNGCLQFGPQYGIQLEINYPAWPIKSLRLLLTVAIWWDAPDMRGAHIGVPFFSFMVFQEKYEPYTRYHLHRPDSPFKLEAA